MTGYLSEIILWLFVVTFGIALGAGRYKSRIAFPQWLVGAGDAGCDWDAPTIRND